MSVNIRCWFLIFPFSSCCSSCMTSSSVIYQKSLFTILYEQYIFIILQSSECLFDLKTWLTSVHQTVFAKIASSNRDELLQLFPYYRYPMRELLMFLHYDLENKKNTDRTEKLTKTELNLLNKPHLFPYHFSVTFPHTVQTKIHYSPALLVCSIENLHH